MNRYGLLARDHWARWLPIRYAALETSGQVEEFFTDLGEQAAARVAALVESMAAASSQPTGEGFVSKAGRLRAWQQAAEEQVLTELVLLPPEDPAAKEETAQDDEEGWAGVAAQMTADYMPLDPRHPLYRDLQDESVSPQLFAARHRAWLESLDVTPPGTTAGG